MCVFVDVMDPVRMGGNLWRWSGVEAGRGMQTGCFFVRFPLTASYVAGSVKEQILLL